MSFAADGARTTWRKVTRAELDKNIALARSLGAELVTTAFGWPTFSARCPSDTCAPSPSRRRVMSDAFRSLPDTRNWTGKPTGGPFSKRDTRPRRPGKSSSKRLISAWVAATSPIVAAPRTSL